MTFTGEYIKADFREFDLPADVGYDGAVGIPTIKGFKFFKYGKHAYYFLNFKSLKGVCVTIAHRDIIAPGLDNFWAANRRQYRFCPKLRSMFGKYHYHFNFPEEIALMTVPHTVTEIGNGRFFVNLWSYFGYIDIDLNSKSAKYVMVDNLGYDLPEDYIFGSQQFYDKDQKELYSIFYSLKDSFKRIDSIGKSVDTKIVKHNFTTSQSSVIFSGAFTDYLHEIIVSKDRRYCVVCELGLYQGSDGEIVPSKVLISDMITGKNWEIAKFIVAAHAQFDPYQDDIVYFSNHNFNFEHSSILKLLKNSTYSVNFRGPASVYKYRLTDNGPVEMGCFTRDDLFRLTNSHIFKHRGQKTLAVIGAPDYIFIANADDMSFMKKIKVAESQSSKATIAFGVGTISPSADGEIIYVQTTKSFAIVDVATGETKTVLSHDFPHSCTNHMITTEDTKWLN